MHLHVLLVTHIVAYYCMSANSFDVRRESAPMQGEILNVFILFPALHNAGTELESACDYRMHPFTLRLCAGRCSHDSESGQSCLRAADALAARSQCIGCTQAINRLHRPALACTALHCTAENHSHLITTLTCTTLAVGTMHGLIACMQPACRQSIACMQATDWRLIGCSRVVV